MQDENTAGHAAGMVTQWKHKKFDQTDSREKNLLDLNMDSKIVLNLVEICF
jgi:hypothetical protein